MNMRRSWMPMPLGLLACLIFGAVGLARGELLAGAAKVDVTDREAGPVNDPLFVKALVLRSGATTVALVTVDAVAIGEIGPIGNGFLPSVRERLAREAGIAPGNLLVNASHCHGIVRKDVDAKTVEAVKLAISRLVPVKVGAGRGKEDRIMENRRIGLADGTEADVRHAYSLPPDDQVAAVGPVDPEIGLLRIDRLDGSTLAVVHEFACHPIQGAAGGGNTADLSGFASQTIEEAIGGDVVALFVQGCGGDVNPVGYKDVDHPRDAEPLGRALGLSALKGLRKIETKADDRLAIRSKMIALPRGDRREPIARLEAERERLLASLTGTTLNLKTFLDLHAKYAGKPFPTTGAATYLHEKALGREHHARLDGLNREAMESYVRHVLAMERITRIQTNLALLRKHQAGYDASPDHTVAAEIAAFRVGDFVLTTFPGELTVRIGLDIKRRAPSPFTFVAGYTNGYLYYAPTAEQLRNVGNAQEDSDCLLDAGWRVVYDAAVDALLDGF
ncbi:MAG: hypothetical protein SFX72_14285 [Isosphaeraceae bacterium]|nr:hypothetical protein [Isosphaeraceae bacterium]